MSGSSSLKKCVAAPLHNGIRIIQAEPAVDEVILKDKRRLEVLDYGGGTDLDGIKEAVDAFKEGNIQ